MSSEVRGSPLPAALRPLGAALEPVYRWAMGRRNRGFDRGDRVWRAPLPTIGVGNLSVGGTGKTPMVMFLARELLARGVRPVIAMRGYAKRAGEASDEEREYLAALEGVRVLAHPDRAASIASFLDEGGKAGCVLLDDAFQHRFVARDVDIVLLDATRDPFEDRCLPAGWLREPVGSLRRANAVVLTRVDRVASRRVDEIVARVRGVVGDAPVVATTSHAWAWVERKGGAERLDPTVALRGKRVHVVAGIGNPGAFAAQARSLGALVAGETRVADHAHYTKERVGSIVREAERQGAGAVLTTAKDWVKLAPLLPPETASGASSGVEWLVPGVELEFHEGREDLLRLVEDAALPTREEVPSP